MKGVLAGGVAAALLIAGTKAQVDGGEQSSAGWPPGTAPDWSAWTRPLAPAPPTGGGAANAPPADIDVVDAHWMALTIWGEARGGGEEAMRAVGHVIDNRRRAGLHGAFATDAVSEAFQFSCWNPGDPNRAAIERIDSLAADSSDGRAWALARSLAAEILAGRSSDPTGGALFYHTAEVTPGWSAGIAPVRQVGDHLFFLRAR